MGQFAFLVLVIFLIVLSIVEHYRVKNGRKQLEQDLKLLGLVVQVPWAGRFRSAGTVRGMEVTVEELVRGSGKYKQTRYVVTIHPPRSINVDFKFSREHLVTKLFGDLRTGDAGFDAIVAVARRDEAATFAFLDAQTRERIMRQVQCQECSIEPSAGTFEVQQNEAHRVFDLVKTGAALYESLSSPESMSVRLQRMLVEDPVAEVRARALELLLQHDAKSEGTRKTLGRAIYDAHPPIACRAALAAGDDGIKTLSDRLLSSDSPLTSIAVDILAQSRSQAVFPLMRRALEQPDTCAVAARHLANAGDRESLPRIVRLLEVGPPVGARPALLEAVGLLGDAGSVPWLLTQLEDTRLDAGSQVAVIHALGALGDVSVVERLLPFTERFLGGEAKTAARQAIAKLQSGIPGVAPGMLSLAEVRPAEGGLSLSSQAAPGSLELAGTSDARGRTKDPAQAGQEQPDREGEATRSGHHEAGEAIIRSSA